MTLDDVDLDQRIVWVLGKDRRPRALPIGRKTAQALDRYLRAREGHRLGHLPHLWVGRNGPMTPIGDLPGRPRSRSRGRAAGHAPHQLRHAFASSWLAEGGNEDEPMLVAGWKSRAMIDRTPGPRPLSKNRAWQAAQRAPICGKETDRLTSTVPAFNSAGAGQRPLLRISTGEPMRSLGAAGHATGQYNEQAAYPT
jgi:integrase